MVVGNASPVKSRPAPPTRRGQALDGRRLRVEVAPSATQAAPATQRTRTRDRARTTLQTGARAVFPPSGKRNSQLGSVVTPDSHARTRTASETTRTPNRSPVKFSVVDNFFHAKPPYFSGRFDWSLFPFVFNILVFLFGNIENIWFINHSFYG